MEENKKLYQLESGEWALYPYLITCTDKGQREQKYVDDIDYYEAYEKLYDDFAIEKTEHLSYSDEQIGRLAEIQEMKYKDFDEIYNYVMSGAVKDDSLIFATKVVTKLQAQLKTVSAATRKLINIDELTEEELTEIVDLYEPYNAEKEYQTGEVFRFEEKLYKAISTNTKEDKEALKPDELPDLYLDIAAEKKKVIELTNKELFK